MADHAESIDLLICGGRRDPSLRALEHSAKYCCKRTLFLGHDSDFEPGIRWSPGDNTIRVDGQRLTFKSAFIRHDVFSAPPEKSEALDRSYGWYSMMFGICAAMNDVKFPNKNMDIRASHKSFMLSHAAKHGLSIPATCITNEQQAIARDSSISESVVKPVAGGAYCVETAVATKTVEWRHGKAPIPGILQEELDYPEYRVFRFGNILMTFEIFSSNLDYRSDERNAVSLVHNDTIGADNISKLIKMSDELAVNYFACDFKTRKRDPAPVFLEMNTAPMFAGFDNVANGKLTAGIVEWLAGSFTGGRKDEKI